MRDWATVVQLMIFDGWGESGKSKQRQQVQYGWKIYLYLV
jgi:hypothetical protein